MKKVDPKKLDLIRIDVVAVAICVVLALFAYFSGFRPIIRRQRGLATQRVELKKLEKRAIRLAEANETLKVGLGEFHQALEGSPVRLQVAGHVNSRIAKLAKLVSSSGLKIDEIHPGKTSRGNRFQTTPITLAGRGTYPTCAVLLRRLRQVFPDTAVMSFDLAGNPSMPSTPATFKMRLIWYAAAKPAF